MSVFNHAMCQQDSSAQCIVGNPPYLLNPQIIGAEDDYFDSQQEQVSKDLSSLGWLDVIFSSSAWTFKTIIVSPCMSYAVIHIF